MSNALAVAAVSVVLKDRLQVGLLTRAPAALATAAVTALPPDRITTGAAETSQLNLFLYQATSSSAFSNNGLPARDRAGQRIANEPLALNLHYLLSAYGARDFHPEVLLGCGMQVLHETPVLTRQAIRDALAGGSLPADLATVADAGLADQIELVKITPQPLSTEETSKLWAALQAHYRPTAGYLVTVVLIEAEKPSLTPLPVLVRRGMVQPYLTPPLPTLLAIRPADSQPSARLDTTVTLEGHHLAGANIVVLVTQPRQIGTMSLVPDTATPSQITFRIPDAPADWVAGHHMVAVSLVGVSLQDPDEPMPRTTNELPLALAPTITSTMPMTVARDGAGDATIQIQCAPEVRPEQQASLLLGAIERFAEPHPAQTDTLTFVFRGIAPADYRVRLRVGGVDSRLIDREATPPGYIASQMVTIT
jgi:hypothetical protein